MFGGRRNNNNNDRESLASVVTPENPPKAKGGNVTGFDPEGLERAAKAARELDSSRNASAAIELIKTQEVTKQVNPNITFIHSFFWQKTVSWPRRTNATAKRSNGATTVGSGVTNYNQVSLLLLLLLSLLGYFYFPCENFFWKLFLIF